MMDTQAPETLEFGPEPERLLRDLTIEDDRPGAILHDFGAFLAFIRERDVPLTPMHKLRRRLLPEVNALLAHPIQTGLEKPQQKSYPHVNGLYLLLRASGLTRVAGTVKKPLLVVDDAVYRAWQALNPTERYFGLLEAWFLWARPEIIGEREHLWIHVPDTFRESYWFLQGIPDGGLPVAERGELEQWIRYFLGLHNVGLLELFGLIDVRPLPPEPGEGWRIERVHRTPLGHALLALLYTRFFGDVKNVLAIESGPNTPFGALQPTLRPYFPAWKDNLSLPEWAFRPGAHVFKVTLGKGPWWRIAIPADSTLDDLASAILDAVEFDDDHLYRFEYRNCLGMTACANHPYMDEGPRTNTVRVGGVPLAVGQAMTFIFDFGDWWEFRVVLERVDPEMAIKGAVVLEAEGEPPDQYPVWDDEITG